MILKKGGILYKYPLFCKIHISITISRIIRCQGLRRRILSIIGIATSTKRDHLEESEDRTHPIQQYTSHIIIRKRMSRNSEALQCSAWTQIHHVAKEIALY